MVRVFANSPDMCEPPTMRNQESPLNQYLQVLKLLAKDGDFKAVLVAEAYDSYITDAFINDKSFTIRQAH